MLKRIKLFASALVLSLSSAFVWLAPQASAAGTFTWDGGGSDNDMTTAENWAGDVAPTGDDDEDLVFPANIDKLTVNNDFTAETSFNSITFSGTATKNSNYTLTGNSMVVMDGISVTMTGSSYIRNQTIDMPVVLGGSQAFSATTASLTFKDTIDLGSYTLTVDTDEDWGVTIEGGIDGTGGITKTGTDTGWLYLTGENTYSGATIVSNGYLAFETATGLGTPAAGTTVASGATLVFVGEYSVGDVTVAEPLTLSGLGMFGMGALQTSLGWNKGGPSMPPYPTTTFTGAITLQSNVKVSPGGRNIKITGSISGNYVLSLESTRHGIVDIASTNNTSSTANSVLYPEPKETSYADDQSSTYVAVNYKETVVVTGKRGAIDVAPTGTLKGTGTVGDVIVGGSLAPGESPGCLNTGDLTLLSGSTYEYEVGGTTACSGYDQTVVTGTVTVAGTLDVSRYNNFVPTAGQKYVIISNDAADAVTGTFEGLAEGATFDADGVTWSISYVGGDGNDIELTVMAVSPETGFEILANNPFVTVALMLGAAGGITFMARRQFGFAPRKR